MNKFLLFLLGVVVGQLALVPAMYHLENTPVIRAEVLPNCYEVVQQTFTHQIKNVKDFHGRTNTLTIHLIKWITLQSIYHQRYGNIDDGLTVMGFYDDRTNEIFCVYDANVLVHELKHVFEGPYHR